MDDVGQFSETITLYGPDGQLESVRGLVDTGALFTVIPQSILNRLGVRTTGQTPVQFANGQVTQWRLGSVQAELSQLPGVQRPIIVFFGPDDAQVLIGAHTLEAL